MGDDIIFTVGRDGKTFYDPVHGITVHIPSDSLPYGIEQVKVTVKVGFTDHDFSAVDMVVCSATIVIYCVPQVLFTKDVFLEIPHSSSDTNDLSFVKFKDCDVSITGYGEVYTGIFPMDHPYGVIMTKSFSSYVIVKGRRYFYSQSSLRKTRLPQHKGSFFSRRQLRKYFKDHVESNSSLFWFGIKKTSADNENKNNFLFLIAQYTPTGFYVSHI